MTSPRHLPPRRLAIVLAALCLAAVLAAGKPAGAEEQELYIARESVRATVLTGFTRARTSMELVSEVAGRVLSVSADVGDAIPDNRIFARLDPVFVQLDMENNAVLQQQTESRIDYLSTQTKRYRNLVTRESAAQSTLDDLEQQLEQARLSMQKLQVERKRLQETLSRYTIRAPEGWKVIHRDIEPGEWIATGQPLATLGDFRQLTVPFALTPTEYQWLRKNEGDLWIRFSDLGGYRIAASLYKVSPSFDPETRKINVELAVNPGEVENRGGLRVELSITEPDQTGAVLTPRAALQERYDEYWLTRENGEEIRVVLLGSAPDQNGQEMVRITSPVVKPGDRFVKPREK